MAEIKMDVSEYNEIMENKKLLKESLKREKELNTQIQKLNEEKLKAYEDAKMQVVCVNKTIKKEFLVSDVSTHRMYEALTQRQYGTMNDRRGYQSFSHISGEDFIELYTTKRQVVEELEPEITLKGFDEVKAEIRKELKSKIDADIKAKLESYPYLVEKDKEHSKVLKQRDSMISDLEQKLEMCEKALSNTKEELGKVKASEFMAMEAKELTKKIKDILGNSLTRTFHKKRIINQLDNLINRDYYNNI